jgi:hypothetical protein
MENEIKMCEPNFCLLDENFKIYFSHLGRGVCFAIGTCLISMGSSSGTSCIQGVIEIYHNM